MNIGDLVPDFTLPDQTGTPRSLGEFLAQGPVVLFFYPAAMSPGCTKEACHFRDLATEFKAVGAQRLGISPDAPEKQQQFAERHSFDYPLLSDPDGKVAGLFDARRGWGPLNAKRKTFVIDTDFRLIEAIKSELNMNTHADMALEALRERGPAAR
ncbi:peroxiredoxin [Streptacidiphilus fuscans]|uniref:thioredoxin-dependent peroxiredoxin n=1 Tax=Streptacidiphilus fuscans TaxID=2789292 RepID=A0A931BBJ4_9ACTN|nr:peroxiredoxin [Streptacidiphilus fuscans]MBF9073147.1 peroxiredoxin [Streptacidiphilus fuscans]